jgi:hydroxylysine kinase
MFTAASPNLSDADVTTLLADLFGVSSVSALKPLPSERDQNVRVTRADGTHLVFKIAREDRAHLEAQTQVLQLLEPLGCCPAVVASLKDQSGIAEDSRFPGLCFRLLSYVPGLPLASLPIGGDSSVLESVGELAGRLQGALAHFSHPVLQRSDFQWDLRNYESVVKRWLPSIARDSFREQVERVFALAHAVVAPMAASLPCQTCHNDLNTHNVLLDGNTPFAIDFGDLQFTWRIAEPAILAAYCMLKGADPLFVHESILRGYERSCAQPLSPEERRCFFPLAALRLCTSAVIAAAQCAASPFNAHLSLYQTQVAAAMPLLLAALLCTTSSFRSGMLEDEDFYVMGARETLALEGTFEWTERVEQDTRSEWRGSGVTGGAVVALDATGARAGFITFAPGSRVPFGPPNGAVLDQSFLWVGWSYVSQSHRRMGVAKLLYVQAFARAEALGVPQLQLDVYEKNTASIAFHEAIGFECYAKVFRRPAGKARDHAQSALFDARVHGDFVASKLGEVLASFGISNGGEKRAWCLERYGPGLRVAVDAGGVPIGLFHVSFGSDHPFGVSYGRYQYSYVFLDFAIGGDTVGAAALSWLDSEAERHGVAWTVTGALLADATRVDWLRGSGFLPYVRVFHKQR